jgi:predicted amidophosphoribosyltransferase
LAEVLAEHFVLTQNNTEAVWREAVLMPVPLAKKRLKARGYNQSEELAKELGQIIPAKERKENLKNAFSVKNPNEIKGRKIFLVDDVYTTGSTMAECAIVLKNAGAKQVWGISVAREG